MNFLAHLYLAAPSEALMAGGFLGDFVKGRLRGAYPHELEQGIRLHRYIDSYTNGHAALGPIRASIPVEFRRYSGIISDLLCDHYLSLNWHEFSDAGIAEFNDAALGGLSVYRRHFPAQADRVLDRMTNGGWLLNYDRMDFVCGALSRIGWRLKHRNPLYARSDQLPAICEAVLGSCGDILYDCRYAVAEWRAGNA